MAGNSHALSPCSLGCSLGLVAAVGMLFLGWLGWCCHFGLPLIHLIASVYVGYAPTLMGGIIGAIWALIDFFIAGVLVAWVYNRCLCCTACCSMKPQSKADTSPDSSLDG